MDLTTYKNYLVDKYQGSSTVRNYLSVMKHFFKSYTEFNQENVNEYTIKISSEGKQNSRYKAKYALESFGVFINIPVKVSSTKIGEPEERQSLTNDEIENEILPYFSQLFPDDFQKREFVFRFMVLTMLRHEEILNLKKSDIWFDDKILKVFQGKGGRNRTVPIHKTLLEELKKYCDESKSEYALDITNGYVKHMVDTINDKLMYKKRIFPHLLRHSGAKLYYKQTHDLEGLRKILGHKSIETTKRYIGYNDEDVMESFKEFKYKKRRK